MYKILCGVFLAWALGATYLVIDNNKYQSFLGWSSSLFKSSSKVSLRSDPFQEYQYIKSMLYEHYTVSETTKTRRKNICIS